MTQALAETTALVRQRSTGSPRPAFVGGLQRRTTPGGPVPRWCLGDGRAECTLLAAGLLLCGLAGCVAPGTAREREVEAAARALLEMHPDANWTACYNRLLELSPASIDYLALRPIMQRPAAPDDLRLMLHTSLLRLLADPIRAPRLSVNCFETTLGVLHFDPKIRGRRLGEVRLPTTRLPVAWHDLYPTDFDHRLAMEINLEADRRAMLRWWHGRRGQAAGSSARRPLRPCLGYLWPILGRRCADVWIYELRPQVVLCAQPPGSALFSGRTYDYNLVRAVCIWLATSGGPGVQRQLAELVAHRSPIVAHNARFALQHSSDPRIREVLERYNGPTEPAAPAAPYHSATRGWPDPEGVSRELPFPSSCEEQRSATHEMDQVYGCVCGGDRRGNLYRRQVRQSGSPSSAGGG